MKHVTISAFIDTRFIDTTISLQGVEILSVLLGIISSAIPVSSENKKLILVFPPQSFVFKTMFEK